MPSNFSELETKILAGAAKAEGNRLTVEQLAFEIGCSPDKIHQKMQNPEFRDLFLDVVKNSLSPEVPAILGAFVERAREGSYKHGKLILEIAGVYKKEERVTGDLNLRVGESPFKDEQDRLAMLQATYQAAMEQVAKEE